MIPMAPHTLSLEQRREPQARRNKTLVNSLGAILRLAHDKLANLDSKRWLN